MTIQSTDLHQRLLALRDTVFQEWLNAVRTRVSHAQKLPTALLVDTLPVFYEHLCAVASGARYDYSQSTLASEHGGERARLTRYDVETVAHELQLFRAAMFKAWNDAGTALSADQTARLNSLIDEAIRESITGFVLTKATAREQFISAVAHDIRTQLSTASMAVDHIAQAGDMATVRKLAELASRQHGRIGAMLSEMLDMAMASPPAHDVPELQALDLCALLRDVIRCSVAASRRIAVPDSPVHGYWHRDSLRRAIDNLLANAVEYSDPGSPIDVVLRSYGGRVALSVTNAGPPIPPERLEAIFQLYKRTASKGEGGWEIGLPFVRSVAEQHAGSIAVECRNGRTTFILDTPLDPRPILAARYGM
ncbi:hypothetical protein GJV26_26160 [Massilia dura]|uniref:histidine kinase n=1 Tax=Pseudoduganella dura TaxID=321982 RepID=A0A6I3XHF8_9BURK|nr:HAMP domain-containing sensor histidine kinase [Pseudoduganella dura]MUI15917.1 hypothetical protein [Pseudoduganella dura]GGX94573.1 hypothetical protein GCM10007386_26810 [Pseudoduganella dura]